MKLTISTVLLLPLSALAADCGNKFMGIPDESELGQYTYGDARKKVCSCIGTQPGFCSLTTAFYEFAIWGHHPSEQLCNDATANIINQCIGNGEFLFLGERIRIHGLIWG